jgi:GNAT superfamily N-acetyltransferase
MLAAGRGRNSPRLTRRPGRGHYSPTVHPSSAGGRYLDTHASISGPAVRRWSRRLSPRAHVAGGMTDASARSARGPWQLLLRVVRGLPVLLAPCVRVRRLLFYESDLDGPPPPPLPRPSVPLSLHVATRDELLARVAELPGFGVDVEEAVRRLDDGDVAIVGIVDRELAHLQWISFRSPWVNEIGVTLRLATGESTAYGAFTAPAWRGHGIHALASRFLNEEQRRRGATRMLAWVWASNRESRRVLFSKLGRRRTKTVWSFWVLGMRRPLLIGATAAGSPSLVRGKPGPRSAARP